MLWDIIQQVQIQQLYGSQAAASGPRLDVAQVRSQADRLEDLLYRLLLANEAMWSLCSERLGLTEADLVARMQQIDASDGRVDGRHTSDPATRRCPSCHAVVPSELSNCQFCGAAAAPGNPFAGR